MWKIRQRIKQFLINLGNKKITVISSITRSIATAYRVNYGDGDRDNHCDGNDDDGRDWIWDCDSYDERDQLVLRFLFWHINHGEYDNHLPENLRVILKAPEGDWLQKFLFFNVDIIFFRITPY